MKQLHKAFNKVGLVMIIQGRNVRWEKAEIEFAENRGARNFQRLKYLITDI